jgi:hypothetical protein
MIEHTKHLSTATLTAVACSVLLAIVSLIVVTKLASVDWLDMLRRLTGDESLIVSVCDLWDTVCDLWDTVCWWSRCLAWWSRRLALRFTKWLLILALKLLDLLDQLSNGLTDWFSIHKRDDVTTANDQAQAQPPAERSRLQPQRCASSQPSQSPAQRLLPAASGSATTRITDRRRNRALAANPASGVPAASKLKSLAAVRVHPIVGPVMSWLKGISLQYHRPVHCPPACHPAQNSEHYHICCSPRMVCKPSGVPKRPSKAAAYQ